MPLRLRSTAPFSRGSETVAEPRLKEAVAISFSYANFRKLVVAFALTASAFAHTGEPLEPHDLWSAWEFDPGVVIPLAFSAILYWRGASVAHGIRRREIACFWAGWITLAVALVSPVHPMGESLFSAHMLQHELLMVLAAPLLVLGRPLVPFLWGMPEGMRRTIGRASKAPGFQRTWRGITRPFVAWWIHAIALWTWHMPVLFDATLRSDAVHTAQHISFLGSALLFWWSVLGGRESRISAGAGIVYIFTTAVHTSVLGALLTFSPTLWYPAYSNTTAAWGLTPLEDQQLGGLIMWIPAGITYVVAGLWLLASWLRESEWRVLEREGEGM
jgi:cytochrome c oxidase assembly factor CtaG